jgi:protein-L-isoaspartate(D-aspartate) O-methyltransferase
VSGEGLPAGGAARRPAADRLARRLAAGGVSDPRVLAAVAAVPRNLFVPPSFRDAAWENVPLPIGRGQTISAPFVVARMCELLELSGTEHVLDVGTGSGYHAALLARLAARVWTIERHAVLSSRAEESLRAAGIENVTLLVGDGSLGYPAAAPYDAINVAAAAKGSLPAPLEDQLAPGGRLVAPVDGRDQRLVLARRSDGEIERRELDPVRFVPLHQG